MKSIKILLAATATIFSFSAFSQTDTTKKDSIPHKMDTTAHKMDTTKRRQNFSNNATTTTTPSVTNSGSNSTSGSSVTNIQSSTPKPNFGRYYIPVLGNYNAVATVTGSKSISITGDENNAGKIWIEGLSGSRFYALLKTAPDTYKIPTQKLDNITIAEGTLIYDENSKQVNVCTGCGFNEKSPTVNEVVAATTAETKSKKHQQIEKVKKASVINFTGIKAEQGTVSLLQ